MIDRIGIRKVGIALVSAVGTLAVTYVAAGLDKRRRGTAAYAVLESDVIVICRQIRSLGWLEMYAKLAQRDDLRMERLILPIGEGHFEVYKALVGSFVLLPRSKAHLLRRFYGGLRGLQNASSSEYLTSRMTLGDDPRPMAEWLHRAVEAIFEIGDVIVSSSKTYRLEDAFPDRP